MSGSGRSVIFNADDFGLNAGVNRGVITSHEQGVVRSTSIMVEGDAFREAADYALLRRSLDLGVHLALCEVRPASVPVHIPSLVSPGGRFPSGFAEFAKRYVAGRINLYEVEKEFRAQLKKALDAGLVITHLDSHQHLHAMPSIFKIVARLAKEHGIPAVRCPDERGFRFVSGLGRGNGVRFAQRLVLSQLSRVGKRMLSDGEVRTTDGFFGFMDMGCWNVKSLRSVIRSLPAGITEICCHPRAHGRSAPVAENGFERETEVFSSGALREILEEENIEVTSFGECFRR